MYFVPKYKILIQFKVNITKDMLYYYLKYNTVLR